MTKKLRLQEIAQELDGLPDQWTAYLNRETGEVYTVDNSENTSLSDDDDADPDLDFLPDWQREDIAKKREIQDDDKWIALPDKFEIHEWSMMRDFAQTVTDPSLRDELLRAIHGSGAFRYFKDVLHRHQIQDQWYQFKAEALNAIVASFLDANGIPYTR